MPLDPTNLTRRTVKAGAWTVGSRLVAKSIDLAMLLCLARFLGPADFGLVAMAMAAVFIVEALFELPMAAALIRVPTLTPAMLHTAFTLSLLRGLLIACVLIALSWPLAAFNGEPRLMALMAVLALAPALRGLVNPRIVEYARALNFRPDTVMELSAKALAFTASVALAVTTRSYWAIAAATVCGPLVSTLLSYCIAPMRPRLTLSEWRHFSNLVGWNFLSQLFAALNWQIDRLLLPRLTTDATFGQYAMSKQVSEMPMQVLIAPLARPTIAALSTAGSNRCSRYLQLSHGVALAMIPVLGVPLLCPEALIRIILGPGWEPAAQGLRWLSAVALLGLPAVLVGPLAMTLDRTRWVAVRNLVELSIRLPLVGLGIVFFGVPGAIAGSAIATASSTLGSLFMVRRLLDVGLGRQLMALWRPLLAMLPAGGVLWLAKPALAVSTGLAELLLKAALVGALYASVYALSLALAWWLAGRPAGLERHLIEMLGDRFKRSNNAMEFHGNQTH